MNKQARLILAVAMFGLAYFFFSQQNKTDPNQTGPSVAGQPAPEQPKQEAPKGPGPREFLVAKQNLDPALVSKVTTDQVELRAVPESIPLPDPSMVYKSFDQIQNKVLVSQVLQGELLLKTRFADARLQQVQKRLRDVIPAGFRAISLDVDAVTGSAGFINQGDIVDVLATYTAGGRQLTRIIIQNVEVLARGNTYNTINRPNPDRMIRGDGGGVTFTLKVKPDMAVKLAHIVDERGFNRFRLVLKNRDDKVQLFSQGVLLREVITDIPRPRVRPGEMEQPPEIEILRGPSLDRASSEDQVASAVPPPGEGGQSQQGGQPQKPSNNDIAARVQVPAETGGDGDGRSIPPRE